MSVMSKVKMKIEKLEEGSLFTFQLFRSIENKQAVSLSLSRLCKQGLIKRLKKGRYYKPRSTSFGTLGPTENDIISNLLTATRYISDIAAFNSLGLTTQVPSEITIKGDVTPRKAVYGNLRVRFQKSDVKVTPGNVYLLQVLDALQCIKDIPDADVSTTFKRISKLVLDLDSDEKETLVKLARNYTSSVRAMLGAILDEQSSELARNLKESLNPLTSYKIGISDKALPNRSEWRIV